MEASVAGRCAPPTTGETVADINTTGWSPRQTYSQCGGEGGSLREPFTALVNKYGLPIGMEGVRGEVAVEHEPRSSSSWSSRAYAAHGAL